MPRTWSSNTAVQRHSGTVWRRFDSELAVLDPAVGRLSTLNEVATRCWELADGRSFDALIEALLNEFEVERNELERDVRTLLDELEKRGLLAQ